MKPQIEQAILLTGLIRFGPLGMHINIQQSKEAWEKLLDQVGDDLKGQLSGLELSALHAWLLDCHESYSEIYSILLVNISKLLQDEDNDTKEKYDAIMDNLIELRVQFDHIRNHINDAEEGLNVLIKIIDDRIDG